MPKPPFLLALISFLASAHCAHAAGDRPPVVEETVSAGEAGEEARFRVSLDEELAEVKVVQVSPAAQAGAVKLRILRKGKKPLEVKLRALEKQEDRFAYTGKASPWGGSLIGFELDFSFDKKTWKKIKKLLP